METQLPAGYGGQRTLEDSFSVASEQPTLPLEDRGFPGTSSPRLGYRADDYDRVAKCYRHLGGSKKWGKSKVIPRSWKVNAIHGMDPAKYSKVKLAGLRDSEIDALLFVLTGLQPDTYVKDMDLESKFDFQVALTECYLNMCGEDDQRIRGVASNMHNVIELAVDKGFNEEDLSDLSSD